MMACQGTDSDGNHQQGCDDDPLDTAVVMIWVPSR